METLDINKTKGEGLVITMSLWENQANLTAAEWLLKAVIMYLYLLFLTKLMGQREIGKLTLFDFVIAISIGSVLGGSLSSTSGLRGPVISIATLAVLQIVLGLISLKFPGFRRIVEEEPIILIQNGVILEKALGKTRVNLDDLLAELRIKGYFFPGQVEFAVLEPNGKISVLPKSQNRKLTPKDMQITTDYEGYPVVVIEDGNVIDENLHRNDLDSEWLIKELKQQNISSPSNVFLAILNTNGDLYISLKNSASERTASN